MQNAFQKTANCMHGEFLMKKKIMAVMLVFSMLAMTFAGCTDIIKKNEGRDFNQIISSVTYTTKYDDKVYNMSSSISKGDFVLSFNSNAAMYMQYYGMTKEQAAEYILKSMSQKELMTLFAKAYVIKNGIEGTSKTLNPENSSNKEVLTNAEIDKAIKATNKEMKSALDSIIEQIISDESKNSGDTTTEKIEDSSKDEVTNRVIFDSKGGSSVDDVIVGKGKKVIKPANPTKTDYTFGGWYLMEKNANGDYVETETKFIFTGDKAMTINARTYLYAKWLPYKAPRVQLPKATEYEEEFDPMKEVATENIEKEFFDEKYQVSTNKLWDFETIKNKITVDDEKFTTEDAVKAEKERKLAVYISEGLAKLQKNMKANYRDYNYYLNEKYKSVLLEKFQRAAEGAPTVSQQEIQKEFDKVVAQNKETFKDDDKTKYENALKTSLTSTYFHSMTGDKAYAFTSNILLKFDAETLKKLTDIVSGPDGANAEQIKKYRDELAQSFKVKVSNPYYDAEAKCDVHECSDASCDPMTCPEHTCNQADKNSAEDYKQIVKFEIVDGKPQITFSVKEENNCKTMAYLLTSVDAFGADGIVQQIKNSLDSVKNNATLSPVEKTYWLNEVYKTWLYLVGDDTGGTNTESNNKGKGYLISGEGTSGYISEYTDQARELMKKGTGTYTTDGTTDGMYVVGDNFIDEKQTSNAYAGIFIILITEMPYDAVNYKATTGNDLPTGDNLGNLSLDYVISITRDFEGIHGNTIQKLIEEKLIEGKKFVNYNKIVNDFLQNKMKDENDEYTDFGKFEINTKLFNEFLGIKG